MPLRHLSEPSRSWFHALMTRRALLSLRSSVFSTMAITKEIQDVDVDRNVRERFSHACAAFDDNPLTQSGLRTPSRYFENTFVFFSLNLQPVHAERIVLGGNTFKVFFGKGSGTISPVYTCIWANLSEASSSLSSMCLCVCVTLSALRTTSAVYA